MNWVIGVWAVVISGLTIMDFWCMFCVPDEREARWLGAILNLITAIILWLALFIR